MSCPKNMPARCRAMHILLSVLLHMLCAHVSAHVEMKEPPPRHSQFSKFYLDNDDVDYNMNSPLGPMVGYPCRNFKAGPTQGTMVAGHPFPVKFDGVATHLGGDCQFAVSYDNGTTFAVIWDKLASCFLDTVNSGYEVPVPDTLPAAKKAIFAWTWINGMGSREFYMNCADVRIENYGHQEPLTAHELLAVNLPGRSTVTPKTGREEDRLIPLLKQRPFITVGKPLDLAQEELGGDQSAQGGEADPFASNAATAGGDDDQADEVTSYVFTTRTITDDDNFDLWPASSGSAVCIDVGIDSSRAAMPLDLGLPPAPSETAETVTARSAMATEVKTVTMDGKPVLQVVVRASDTAAPSSLTDAY